MYTLMEELARDHQRTLLRQAVAERRAAQLRGARGAETGRAMRLATVRRKAGGVLISAGRRLAGVATATEGHALR